MGFIIPRDFWKYVSALTKNTYDPLANLSQVVPDFEKIPTDLLNEAIATWQKPGGNKPHQQPRMFRYRHALKIANISPGRMNKANGQIKAYSVSTLDRYIKEGKRLLNESPYGWQEE
ncbi:MAG: hypothetical protein R2747_18825 [Pyrinomonadaceae bacterium]